MHFTKVSFLFIILLFIGPDQISGQTILQNKKPNTRTRFTEYSGQPYYFKENTSAKIYLKNSDEPYEVEKANINIISNCVEIFEGKDYIDVELKSIEKVSFQVSDNEVIGQSDGANGTALLVTLYNSDQYIFTEKLQTRIEERVYNSPGKNITKQLIRKKQKLELSKDGSVRQIKISKKDLLKLLGKEAENIAKSTKNKLKSKWDLVQLLGDLN